MPMNNMIITKTTVVVIIISYPLHANVSPLPKHATPAAIVSLGVAGSCDWTQLLLLVPVVDTKYSAALAGNANNTPMRIAR